MSFRMLTQVTAIVFGLGCSAASAQFERATAIVDDIETRFLEETGVQAYPGIDYDPAKVTKGIIEPLNWHVQKLIIQSKLLAGEISRLREATSTNERLSTQFKNEWLASGATSIEGIERKNQTAMSLEEQLLMLQSEQAALKAALKAQRSDDLGHFDNAKAKQLAASKEADLNESLDQLAKLEENDLIRKAELREVIAQKRAVKAVIEMQADQIRIARQSPTITELSKVTEQIKAMSEQLARIKKEVAKMYEGMQAFYQHEWRQKQLAASQQNLIDSQIQQAVLEMELNYLERVKHQYQKNIDATAPKAQ